MKPVMQTILGYPNGNCWVACVASLLEMDIEQVPHFNQLHGEHWFKHCSDWLINHGYGLLELEYTSKWWLVGDGPYVIVTGKSPRGDWQHAVIGKVINNRVELVHDPHPDGLMIEGEPNFIDFFVPLEIKSPSNTHDLTDIRSLCPGPNDRRNTEK